MTRDEFYNNITEWWDLIDICNDYNLTACNDVFSDDQFCEIIDEALAEAIGYESWHTIKDWLNYVPTGYDYYFVDEEDPWNHSGLDDSDFLEYKDQVAEDMEYMGLFDATDDDDDVDPEDLIPVADEPIAFDDFMNASLVALDTAQTNKQMDVVATSEFLVVEAAS